MIDLLLRFSDFPTACAVGQAMGFATPPATDSDSWNTTLATESLAICVIGEHYIPTGETLTDGEGTTYPEMIGDGKWWVMVRALDDREIPEAIIPFIVTPDAADPSIPNRRWAA